MKRRTVCAVLCVIALICIKLQLFCWLQPVWGLTCNVLTCCVCVCECVCWKPDLFVSLEQMWIFFFFFATFTIIKNKLICTGTFRFKEGVQGCAARCQVWHIIKVMHDLWWNFFFFFFLLSSKWPDCSKWFSALARALWRNLRWSG